MRNLIFYSSYYEAIKELPDDAQGRLYKAIIDYAMEGKELQLNGFEKSVFVLIKPTLDASNRNYENGKKGGRPSQNNRNENPKKNQSITETETDAITQMQTEHTTEVESYQIFDKEKDKENKEREIKEVIKERVKERNSHFVPPTLEEVECYANERDSSVDPQKFFDYFQAGGWVDSKGNKVKNWKQKFITWENQQHEITTQRKPSQLERAAVRLGVV